MLDAMSPDPDIEDGADEEPSLGWSADHAQGVTDDREGPDDDLEPDNDTELNGDERDASCPSNRAKGGHWREDVEEENEHGGDILDEPHDRDGDDEPWLGWSETCGQGPKVGIDCSMSDIEPDCCSDDGGVGCGLGFTGEGHAQAREMLRGRGRNEPSLTIIGPAFPLFDYRR